MRRAPIGVRHTWRSSVSTFRPHHQSFGMAELWAAESWADYRAADQLTLKMQILQNVSNVTAKRIASMHLHFSDATNDRVPGTRRVYNVFVCERALAYAEFVCAYVRAESTTARTITANFGPFRRDARRCCRDDDANKRPRCTHTQQLCSRVTARAFAAVVLYIDCVLTHKLRPSKSNVIIITPQRARPRHPPTEHPQSTHPPISPTKPSYSACAAGNLFDRVAIFGWGCKILCGSAR